MDAAGTAEIVERVRRGETEAYAELVRAFQPAVWRVAAALLGSIAETEDLVQQAFVDAFLKLDQFRPDGDFAVWVSAIARNLMRQELRRRGREDRRLAVYRRELLARLEDGGDADARVPERERVPGAALEACLEALRPAAGEALRLRYRQNLPLAEVAGRLGQSLEACQRMLSRARTALRVCIEKRMAGA